MSATGRGPRRGGPDDFFATPAWSVARFLEQWNAPERPGLWVEPGAGDGAIIRAVNTIHADSQIRWLAIESRATCTPALAGTGATVRILDFLGPDVTPDPDVTVVMGNPPFSQAEAFIRQARRLYEYAEIVFLLRLAFLATDKRWPLYRDLGVPNVYVLPDRPSFTPDGGTDATDYGWFCWPPAPGMRGGLRILNTTPLEVRRPGGRKRRRAG